MKYLNLLAIAIIATSFLMGCTESITTTTSDSQSSPRFKLHSPEKSGIQFSNILDEPNLKSMFNYINLFSGGGVAIGDIDNDGFQDVLLTGNRVPGKLFLNKKDLKFEDITQKSGINITGWATGVTMADVNNDGWLDIYVCQAYYDEPAKRANLLFINNKNGTFTESAAQYGIDDTNYSIGASFLDYDRDGDLDLIVANHPRFRQIMLSKHIDFWNNPPMKFSSRLFKNEGGKFKDVTIDAGILSYGFCLGVTTSDYNSDGWPDIFLSVDHNEEDIVFKNMQDGTFKNVTHTALKQSTRSSMGIDAGDVNHDLHPDILVVEMLPGDYYREKISMGMQTIDLFNYMIDSAGYQYYQMRNFLHLNNGNGTFSDVSQMAGMHKSDWSWGALFMDIDNDSWQDIYIGNGIYKDLYNKDYMKILDKKMMSLKGDMAAMNKAAKDHEINCKVEKISNYMYQSNGDMTFKDISKSAGFGTPTISAGTAYGDLDNDGDLDIVVNNTADPAFLYENQTKTSNNYLRVKFAHQPSKTSLGAKVIIHNEGDLQKRELLATRGFQASSELVAHFGLGKATSVEKVEVVWPNGKKQTLTNVPANQILTVEYKNATENYIPPTVNQLVKNIPASASGVDFVQQENPYDDYADQILLPHKMSEQGPFLTKGDVNGDGLEDFYVGAPIGQAGSLYIQNQSGKFQKKNNSSFNADSGLEDGGAAFFDADGDGDQDLMVASAGYEFVANSQQYQSRLYLNDGKGNFTKTQNNLPEHKFAGSCVKAADIDADGDMDVFVGGLLSPKRYPEAGTSALFINDGKGVFSKHSDLPFANSGMVKDAIWNDLNGDKKMDLIIVGEWMPVSFWQQTDTGFEDVTNTYLPQSTTGWWNNIEAADLDGNGLTDFVVGNLGLNYKYKASEEKPFSVNGKDIDGSGTYDIVLSCYYGDKVYPVRGRTCSAQQVPEVAQKFPSYHEFSVADVDDLYGEELDNSLKYEATMFSSIILYQEEGGKFTLQELPFACQSSPVNGIVFRDVNKDSKMDMILAGNLYQSEIETGRADFGTGEIVLNQGDRKWKALDVHESGLYISGDVKSLELIELGPNKKPTLLVGNNKGPLELVEILEDNI